MDHLSIVAFVVVVVLVLTGWIVFTLSRLVSKSREIGITLLGYMGHKTLWILIHSSKRREWGKSK
jgi:hypothetical protein